MNPIIEMLLNALVKYLQSHPDEVDKLVHVLVQRLTESLAHSSAIAKAAPRP